MQDRSSVYHSSKEKGDLNSTLQVLCRRHPGPPMCAFGQPGKGNDRRREPIAKTKNDVASRIPDRNIRCSGQGQGKFLRARIEREARGKDKGVSLLHWCRCIVESPIRSSEYLFARLANSVAHGSVATTRPNPCPRSLSDADGVGDNYLELKVPNLRSHWRLDLGVMMARG